MEVVKNGGSLPRCRVRGWTSFGPPGDFVIQAVPRVVQSKRGDAGQSGVLPNPREGTRFLDLGLSRLRRILEPLALGCDPPMRILAVHPSPLMYTKIFLRLEPLGIELIAAAA